MSKTNFTGADLTAPNLTKAKLTGTVFRDIKGLDTARDLDQAMFD
ncbi:MAG: pentapeptide repeat-containing protein [Gammaproteobacteria bacterium]|nr:hypothetical protein [Gammaproteobacteria bacterium]NIN60925.1 hypothetical protein [Gammaproteobacteria bacterium]NIO62549.1 hypothetical protein [Gammaproteobacteria bacterium]NIQ10758.1 pentapeptide repeat-containing protein [Gammaproteobacteria bacterium]NIQ18708.1 hypothetical protein [Gammaproteobacteria bacterium]